MSKIIGRPLYAPAPAGGGKPSVPKFTYDGDYVIRDDGVVELLTSGTITFISPAVIDIFCVGGGGGGASAPQVGATKAGGFGGGGGGYTVTALRHSVSGSYLVTIGAGGAAMNDGEATSFGTELSAPGGKSHKSSEDHDKRLAGSNGGSGGGGGVSYNSDYGAGGSDGSNGEPGTGSTGATGGVPGGTGQGMTTREFGESSGKLYAGGGGGGRYISTASPVISMGGPGGGGSGAWYGAMNDKNQAATAGGANTGGGGGGGARNNNNVSKSGASGGSGIVCFREAQGLPELAGTWVLNDKLYAPENSIPMFQLNYQAGDGAKYYNYKDIAVTTAQFYGNRSNGDYNQFYQFSSNKWSYKYKYFTFPAGATASDEFRAWLASNATKQTA